MRLNALCRSPKWQVATRAARKHAKQSVSLTNSVDCDSQAALRPFLHAFHVICQRTNKACSLKRRLATCCSLSPKRNCLKRWFLEVATAFGSQSPTDAQRPESYFTGLTFSWQKTRNNNLCGSFAQPSTPFTMKQELRATAHNRQVRMSCYTATKLVCGGIQHSFYIHFINQNES